MDTKFVFMRKFVQNMSEQIHALLVDDELPACETLSWLLNEYCPEVVVSGVAHSAEAARNFLNRNKIDVIFLDISMPGENGFDLLSSLPKNIYHVVFITAHNDYAIKAFREAAVDYLLKPVDSDELIHAVSRVKDRLAKQNTIDLKYEKSIKDILDKFTNPNKLNRIAVPHLEGIHFILAKDIVYMEADSNYTIFHLLNGGKIVASKTMAEFEQQLPEGFFRIHKSFHINLSHVADYIKKDGNSVIMNDGVSLPVSRRKIQELMQALLIQ